ncbi:MAG: DUF4080 domain-containing protein [Firmicutes bacterium]|nr:DUF4080 domain-containing protein [Bacillota bacterium]
MKILLTTLNSQYVHSNPALKYLYTVTADTPADVDIREFTINNEPNYIYGELVRANYDIVCFSCYIWNIEQTKAIAADLKKARPEIKICLGGPEVSFDAHIFAVENPWVDFILCGEGEYSFYRFIQILCAENSALNKVPGLVYREEGRIYVNPQMEPLDFNCVPFLYSMLECEEDKVVYYESARGCPFKCGYCLSSIEKSIRPLSLDRVKVDLAYFLYKKVMQVKFIDRTFNYDDRRAYEIFRYLIEHDNGVTNFHFEICADLLNERLLRLLSRARKGLFQFEIGIQSTNPETLAAVNRKENVYPVLYNAEKLIELGNIHIHVDLIAGLPYETYEIFERSFNKVYALGADTFQMGFLKVLKGTQIDECREEFGIVARDKAPYEIISNKWMSAIEMAKLKTIEKMLDIYYNRGGFSNTLNFLMDKLELKPFRLFESIANFYYDNGYQHKNRKKEEQYRILLKFADASEINSDEVKCELKKDLEETFNPEEVKRFIKKGWEI